ncbi:hypothetical protein MKA46_07725 [[Clostridium] innocuum]|nr:hypothetical protein HMPREF0983_03662 [Erysipelotrichaceae bacterium 3_1_53]MCR0348067.1 hypothetical protein [[Clostridium] innocuum]
MDNKKLKRPEFILQKDFFMKEAEAEQEKDQETETQNEIPQDQPLPKERIKTPAE